MSSLLNRRIFIVFLLGFSSGLPLALVTSTLQAWFAQAGIAVLTTGMLSLIGLPYVFRLFWGPLLDKYALTALGKRRSWIFFSQLGLLIGFNLLAWLTPLTSPLAMVVLAVVLAFMSATQDMAVDAQRIEYLPLAEHGLGASMAVLGYRLALLVSGGLALIWAQTLGWAYAYRLAGALMGVGILAILWSEEPSVDPEKELKTARSTSSFITPFRELTQRPYFPILLAFILCFKMGEAFTTTGSGIVMPFLIQGIGFSLKTIGYVNKLLGVSAIVLGGIFGGVLLLRCSLYSVLLVSGLLQAASNLLFAALAVVGNHLPLFAVAVGCDNFIAGIGSTALVVLLMRLTDKTYTATQFSVLVAISSIPRVVSGPLAGLLEIPLGWTGLYVLSAALALAFIPFLWQLRRYRVLNDCIFGSTRYNDGIESMALCEAGNGATKE